MAVFAGHPPGDLTIPASRLYDWETYAPGATIPDTSGWTVINVKDPPYNAVGDGVANDYSAIQSAINAAGANTIIYFPAGTYKVERLIADNIFYVAKSNIVFRGDGYDDSIITNSENSGGVDGNNQDSIHFRVEGFFASEVSLTAQANKGDTTLTVQAGHGFSEGDWIYIYFTASPPWYDNATAQQKPPHVQEVKQVGSGVGATTIPITVPIATDNGYPLAYGPIVAKFNPVRNVGFENLQLASHPNHPYRTWKQTLWLRWAVNCWVTGCQFRRYIHRAIFAETCANCTIRSNYFHELLSYAQGLPERDPEGTSNKDAVSSYAMHFFSVTGTRVEDNIFRLFHVGITLMKGANLCVIAYNWFHERAPNSGSSGEYESAIFPHGNYPFAILCEGNASSTSGCSHNYAEANWGRQGDVTLFRSRVEGVANAGVWGDNNPPFGEWSIGPHIATSAWPTAENPNILACSMFGGGSTGFGFDLFPIDRNSLNCWIERCTWLDTYAGIGNHWPGFPATEISVQQSNVPVAWNLPPSLYLTAKPSWWPTGKAWPATGPDIDDYTGALRALSVGSMPSSLITLPAQDRFEGPGTPPDPPTGVIATAGTHEVDLSWTPPAAGPAVVGYDVYRTTPGPRQRMNSSAIAGTTYTVTGLDGGIQYCFVVQSLDAESEASVDSSPAACATVIGSHGPSITRPRFGATAVASLKSARRL